MEKQLFFQAAMAGLGKYYTGGFGRIGVCRVKVHFLNFALTMQPNINEIHRQRTLFYLDSIHIFSKNGVYFGFFLTITQTFFTNMIFVMVKKN